MEPWRRQQTWRCCWMFCGLSSASHQLLMETFMCRWFRILYTGFHFANISVLKLQWDLPVPKIATIWVLLRSCSSETLELWPRLFFLNWYRFFSLNPLWICLCSSRYGVGCTMGLLLWNFWAIGSFWMDLRLLLHQKHYKIGIALVWFSFPCSFLNGQKVVCLINKVINWDCTS